jgi:hypothetical protein
VAEALVNFADYVRQETLAVGLTAVPLPNPLLQQTISLGDQTLTLALRKAGTQ